MAQGQEGCLSRQMARHDRALPGDFWPVTSFILLTVFTHFLLRQNIDSFFSEDYSESIQGKNGAAQGQRAILSIITRIYLLLVARFILNLTEAIWQIE